jgi:hypothetical protein
MRIATAANVRTAKAAREGAAKALPLAFRGGAVMGFTVAGPRPARHLARLPPLRPVLRVDDAFQVVATFGLGARRSRCSPVSAAASTPRPPTSAPTSSARSRPGSPRTTRATRPRSPTTSATTSVTSPAWAPTCSSPTPARSSPRSCSPPCCSAARPTTRVVSETFDGRCSRPRSCSRCSRRDRHGRLDHRGPARPRPQGQELSSSCTSAPTSRWSSPRSPPSPAPVGVRRRRRDRQNDVARPRSCSASRRLPPSGSRPSTTPPTTTPR